jgi:SAM-dependent methyltransferase
MDIPFPDHSFDIVTCLGVLYHKQVDDKKAIEEMFRVCRPGGIVVISTPAMKVLRHRLFRTRHDELHHTARRHSRKELLTLLENAGFSVKKISYHTTFLLFPALLFRVANNIIKEKESELQTFPAWIENILTCIIYLEEPIIRRWSLPFGMGLVAVAQKPNS